MRGKAVVERLVALAAAASVFVAACDATPSLTPRLTVPTPSGMAEPSPSPSPTARPIPPPTPSGIVQVNMREIRGAEGRFGASGVWTGSEVLVWGGLWYPSFFFGPNRYRRSGNGFDPATDTWRPIPKAPISGRYRHLAAWTGSEMLVWGGFTEHWRPGRDPEGAAYNPRTDRWRTMAPSPLPWGQGPVAVMADGEWIVAATRNSGEVLVAAYDPVADSWLRLPTIPAPMTRENSLAWTGTELVLVNSQDRMVRLPDGAAAWIDSTDVPLDVDEIAWTGHELLGLPNSLGVRPLERYVAESDEWVDVPGPAFEHGSMVWTGEQLIVEGPDLAFEPATGLWYGLAWPKDPMLAREDHVSVWTDYGLFEWGGGPGKGDLYNNGVLFTPEW